MADTRLNAVIPKIIATKLIAKRFIVLNILQITNRSTILLSHLSLYWSLRCHWSLLLRTQQKTHLPRIQLLSHVLSETFPSDGLGFIYWRSSLDCYGNVFTARSIDTALQVGRASDETVTSDYGSRATRTSE
jgi:steroid 5-alpha reductase family enzyme